MIVQGRHSHQHGLGVEHTHVSFSKQIELMDSGNPRIYELSTNAVYLTIILRHCPLNLVDDQRLRNVVSRGNRCIRHTSYHQSLYALHNHFSLVATSFEHALLTGKADSHVNEMFLQMSTVVDLQKRLKVLLKQCALNTI